MTAIDLPPLPKLATVTAKLLRFNVDLTPPQGGPMLRVLSLGTRYNVQVGLPSLAPDCGAAWLAKRVKSDTEATPVRLAWPQPPGSAPGLATVAGGGQLGSRLSINATPGFTFKAGRFFSFISGGRSYLHSVTEDVTTGAGVTVLPIGPMLRVSPDAGEALEFAAPVIEGFFDEDSVEWTLERLRYYGHNFSLSEAA